MLKETWRCRILGFELASQESLGRLIADDPCWDKAWCTYEQAWVPEKSDEFELDIRVTKLLE